MNTTTTDIRGFILRSEAVRMTGISKPELEALINSGRVAVRRIPGTRDRVRLADVLEAAGSSTVATR